MLGTDGGVSEVIASLTLHTAHFTLHFDISLPAILDMAKKRKASSVNAHMLKRL